MKTRIITALVGLVIVIPVLIFADTAALPIFIALIAVLGVYELIRCVGQHKNQAVVIPSVILAGATPFALKYLDAPKALGISFSTLVLIATVVYMLWIMAFSVFSHGKFPVDTAALVFMAAFYIIFGFSGIVRIRNIDNGAYIFWLIFIASWIPDTGAYFTGVKLGKHKLIPDVSPKKTVEGAIGGIISCMAIFALYTVIVNNCFDASLNIWLMLAASLILTIVSMIGDLIASLIKRRYDVKDYGKLLPGHGGILDRFDSIIAVSCVMNVLWLIPAFADNILKIG